MKKVHSNPEHFWAILVGAFALVLPLGPDFLTFVNLNSQTFFYKDVLKYTNIVLDKVVWVVGDRSRTRIFEDRWILQSWEDSRFSFEWSG